MRVLYRVVVFALLSLTSCYRYSVTSDVSGAEEFFHKSTVQWSYLWGLVEPEPFDVTSSEVTPALSCPPGSSPKSVAAEDNLLYGAITLTTLGAVSPLKLSWICAAPSSGMPTEQRP